MLKGTSHGFANCSLYDNFSENLIFWIFTYFPIFLILTIVYTYKNYIYIYAYNQNSLVFFPVECALLQYFFVYHSQPLSIVSRLSMRELPPGRGFWNNVQLLTYGETCI